MGAFSNRSPAVSSTASNFPTSPHISMMVGQSLNGSPPQASLNILKPAVSCTVGGALGDGEASG